jgi:diketogulonate reductase-like aldo/keto reductase
MIGEGTWYMERSDRPKALAAIRRGLDLRMNLIDTAELYGNGVAEEIVGEAIAGRRNEAFSCLEGEAGARLPRRYHQGLRGFLVPASRSKASTATCFTGGGTIPLEETISSFEELKRRGKISSWGVSNFDVPDLEEAWDAAGGSGHMATNQVLYHLQDRTIEHSILPWCEKHGVAVMAYSPFGHGDFPSPARPGGRVLQKIAIFHGATPRQVALSFLSRSPAVFAIPKASTVEHLEENAGGAKLQLSEEEVSQIDRAFPLGRSRGLPML